MIVLLLVALAWTGVHNADLPETVPQFRETSPLNLKGPAYLTPPAMLTRQGLPVDTRHHAQRGDGGPTGWQERRFHGLE